eukprot:Nitzschia sp. Nitz4//scaffold70_size99833//32795//36979//NITZ4_004593-RA/size99833-snap-gene-0.132-mRNA-1//1//CDS//3329557129//1663//frame0
MTIVAPSPHSATPKRERVADAMAMVRAQREAAAKKRLAEKAQEAQQETEEKSLRTNLAVANELPPPPPPAGPPPKTKRGVYKPKSTRSNALFQNVFTTSAVQPQLRPNPVEEKPLPNSPSLQDEPEENKPEPSASQAGGFAFNPLELVKREFMLATQSAPRTAGMTAAHDSALPQKDQPKDDESDDESVENPDAKTIKDIDAFLDALHKKDSPPSEAVTPVADANLKVSESDDASDDESYGSVNPETLAEIGAYIDAVSKSGTTVVVEPSVQASKSVIEDHSTTAGKSGVDAPSFMESSIVTEQAPARKRVNRPAPKPEANLTVEIPAPARDEVDDKIVQHRVSQPSPIYAQVEARSLPPGAHMDPPSVLKDHNDCQVDPPANATRNWSATVVDRLHSVAPSFSLESLGSSNVGIEKPAVEDEKKLDDTEFSTPVPGPIVEAQESQDYDAILSDAIEAAGLAALSVESSIYSEGSDQVSELPALAYKNLPNSPSMKDDDSIPWELRDIASEDTMKAAGRARNTVFNPASRSKARQLTSILSDESSVPPMPNVDSTDLGSEGFADNEHDTTIPSQPSLVTTVEDQGEDGVEIVENSFAPSEDYDEGDIEEFIDDTPVCDDPPGFTESDMDLEDNEIKKPDPEAFDGLDAAISAFLSPNTDAIPSAGNQHLTPIDAQAVSTPLVPTTSSLFSNDSDKFSLFGGSGERMAEEEGQGFLEQFESLEVQEEDEEEEAVDAEESGETSVFQPYDLTTIAGILEYFDSLEGDSYAMGVSQLEKVRSFKRLITHVSEGVQPSIIETAQIRQAATLAGISLQVVDTFLDLSGKQQQQPQPSNILNIMSSASEAPSVAQFEQMESLDEDEAISAFLTRFDTLQQGGHFPSVKVQDTQEYINPYLSVDCDENVEVDAEYGFVNKQLRPKSSEEDEDEEQEWWKEGQQQTPIVVHDDSEEWNNSHNDDDDVDDLREAQKGGTSDAPVQPSSTSLAPGAPSGKQVPQVSRRPVQEPQYLLALVLPSDDEEEEEKWLRRQAMGKYGASWKKHADWLSPRTTKEMNIPANIDGVAAAENLRRLRSKPRGNSAMRPWKRLYNDRTQYHEGFLDVDIHSIYESTTPEVAEYDEIDFIPWEHREVKQRFLHEKSYAFSRNWFGNLSERFANQKIKVPVCRPKSMEMPMENIPDPGEWTAEWYTPWKAPRRRRYVESSDDDSYTYTTGWGGSTVGGSSRYSRRSRRSYRSHRSHRSHRSYGNSSWYDDESSYSSDSFSDRSDGDESWEEAPECGELVNVKQKIGERVTLVHHNHLSSLRRSRWRKKYFPRGTFPY